jgi:hypothetical protein
MALRSCFAAAWGEIAKLFPVTPTPAQEGLLLKGGQAPQPLELCRWIVFEAHHCWQEMRQACTLVVSGVIHRSNQNLSVPSLSDLLISI